MEWSAVFGISDVDIHALLMQVVYAQRLVLLSCDVHRSRAKTVL